MAMIRPRFRDVYRLFRVAFHYFAAAKKRRKNGLRLKRITNSNKLKSDTLQFAKPLIKVNAFY